MKEIQTIDNQIAVRPRSSLDIQADVNLIQEVMRQVMKEGTHYGKIPGCGDKASLFKPGAEKIASAFRFKTDIEVEDLSNLDKVRFRVKVNLQSANGTFLGSGIGECSSNEEKYKWRFAVCHGEYEEAKPNKRRKKWKKGWNGAKDTQIEQVRTEPEDQANTVLKMAKKRAFIDAILTVTAASDIFTQDIEDLPPEYVSPYEDKKPEQAILPVYSDEDFQANKAGWFARFAEKKSSPEHLIGMLSAKYTLTESQIKEIKGE